METILYAVKDNLYVNITNKCPCSCIFCIRKNGDGAYGSDSLWLEHEPTLEEIKTAFDNEDMSKYTEIVFCGYGEPTERIDVLCEVCRYIKLKWDIPIRINTNGLSDVINSRKTAKLLEGIVDTVSISLNAGDKEEYLRVTQPKFGISSFDEMLKFADECRKYVKNIMFTVVDVISSEQIEKAYKVADEHKIELRVRKYDA